MYIADGEGILEAAQRVPLVRIQISFRVVLYPRAFCLHGKRRIRKLMKLSISVLLVRLSRIGNGGFESFINEKVNFMGNHVGG